MLGAPLLLLGGRSGAEASSSTMERLDCWAEALSIARAHPILGVGLRQFGEYNDLTAHNSYLLTLSELGVPGMILFSIIVYLSGKIPIVAMREVKSSSVPEGAPQTQPWATALMAAFAGLAVGIFFLSFAYHYVLWIYIGLSGALYMSIRTHLPNFRVRFGWRDVALVAVLDAAVVAGTYLQTKLVLS
jgi:O-antigen ligase